MSKILLCMTAAAALTMGGQAFAASATKAAPPASTEPPASSPATPSTPSSSTPPTSAPSPSGATTGTATDTATTASSGLSVGLPVKDNTGATIGQVSDLKPDATGKQLATITMGADVFSVTADKLAVADGAATINLTQAQITGMLHKPK